MILRICAERPGFPGIMRQGDDHFKGDHSYFPKVQHTTTASNNDIDVVLNMDDIVVSDKKNDKKINLANRLYIIYRVWNAQKI